MSKQNPIDQLIQDREALGLRNQTMAEAFHQMPFRHRVRRVGLQSLSSIYIPHARRAKHTNRILLIRPDHMGDLLLTTPAIRALRAHFPYTQIHALTGPWAADVLENYDEVDLVLTVPFPGFTRGKKQSTPQPYQFAVQTARRLRQIGYAKAIVFRSDHWWGAWLAKLSGIPQRIGYDLPDTSLFLTEAVEHTGGHVVEQNIRLTETITGPVQPEQVRYEYPVHSPDRAFVDGYLAEWGIQPDMPIVAIHPGSGTWVKRWLPERWAAAADALAEQLEAKIVFTGGDHELSLIQTIGSKMNRDFVLMAGDTRIAHLGALYERARVVLGPDSGPMHLAVAVGTPTVTLYGPADPAEFGPWGSPDKHMVIASSIGCRPCRVLDWGDDDPKYHPCVREDISVTQVLRAARDVARQ